MIATSSYSFPVLEEDRFDYIDSVQYKVDQVGTGDDYLIFEHKILGDSLIATLLRNAEAKFVTTVALKSALHRETVDNIEEKISSTHIKQKIPLKKTFETQNFFATIVYTGIDKEIVLDAQKMGLDEFWDGTAITLHKGAILARDGWRNLENTASDLLTVKKDETEKYGFNVTLISQEGGRFIATVQPTLYDTLSKLPNDHPHRNSIIIHMLCLGFMEIHKDYKEDDSELTNFHGIKLELESKGIPTWQDEGFSANDVACHFVQHNLKWEASDD